MSRRVTIVMYHFVRNLRHSRFPEIKGLDTSSFIGQLDYVERNYNVVRMEDVIAAATNRDVELPPRALLLTFDDGYLDHFNTVFPALDARRLQGSFFPPARAIIERRVLDVNKIHFLLASVADRDRLIEALEDRVEGARHEYALDDLVEYRRQYLHANRWDTAEVIFLKRMLQKGLPEALRNQISDELFREFVTADETAFAEELYVSLEQLRCMRRHGMYIGSHSYDHYWLDSLDPPQQLEQVQLSRDFLARVGADPDNWVMCYPYGGYDSSLTSLLQARGCCLGLTTRVAVADLDSTPRLELPRLDTNDMPFDAAAHPND